MTKEDIVQAVVQLIQETGFKNSTVAVISDKLDISTSILYKHFPNKEAILADALDEMNLGLKRQAERSAARTENAIENIIMFRYDVHNFTPIHGIRDRILELRKYYEKNFLRNNTQLQNAMVEIALQIIDRGQKEGLFIHKPNLRTLSLVFHWTFWTPMSTNLPIPSEEEFYPFHNQMFDMFLHGLLTTEGCEYLTTKKDLMEKIHLVNPETT